MKLATLKNGTRDGRLVVVSRDLTQYTSAELIAPTLQAALDDWARRGPALEGLAEMLAHGAVPAERFHERDAMSPLPRAFQRLTASNGATELGLVASDAFLCPRAPAPVATAVPEVAVIVDDVAAGGDRAAALGAVRLILLANRLAVADMTAETAFSPVAVTPDELGDAWDDGRVCRPILMTLNNKSTEVGDARSADFGRLVAHAARARRLCAGTLIGASSSGATGRLAAGDVIRFEMKDGAGHSIVGAIEQRVDGHVG